MTAPEKNLRTPGEEELIERFGVVQDVLPGAPPVKARRAEAFSIFEQRGLPNRRVEEWKYSDLRARLKSAVPLAEIPSAAMSARTIDTVRDSFTVLDCFRLVFVDGFFDADLSDGAALLSEGVEVSALSDLLATDDPHAGDLLSAPEIVGEDIAIALNTAFVGDGVVISIGEGIHLSKPIEILHVASGSAASAIYMRNRFLVGDGAEATVLEASLGGTEGSEINLLADYRVGDGASLTVARLQASETGATHIATNLLHLGEKAQLKHLSVEAGSDFSRNQSFLTFAGEHSEAKILGVSMLDGSRHIDQTLVIDHAVPHCQSSELFKAVVDDRARGVFQGKIIVRPEAQKTSGKMMSQALLLSDEAEMAAKPELEIFADDVVCGHGATSGQIDSEMLFYLMARGIPRLEAERLLIEAFLADVVEAIGDEAIGEVLTGEISSWFDARNRSRGVKAA
jgi:Fe-S cluster assembly protein SufD